ncbi:hypothetical protein DFH08DRAFT_896463 [Mycena albidolilacea]|uniref:Uncharacterized protein n=1 Tax=Mycena albidolilacea TaxID=1033008 RepID=A0AAD6Z912_9AGAR|nr:hypothetical protein DFH08DRAFT_896463 [Mycena albidolilacea]
MPLLVHIPTDFPYTAELFQTSSTPPLRYAQAHSIQEAHIILRCDGDAIVIEPCTPAMRKCYQETRLPLKDSTNLPAALDGVAHFFQLLDRCNEASPLRGITLEMHRLGNMVKDGAVLFASEQGAKYGFTIRNSSAEDLFPYLFYFDPDDYSIQIWYSPNPRGSVPPLLKSGGTATVGMGTDRAFEFKLDPHLGQSQSSGFLKLFVTTEDTREVTSIQQTSPFEQGFPTNVRMIQSVDPEKQLSRVSKWDALTVALTMTAE